MVFTMLSGHPVRFFGLGKFVEADVAHSQVAQDNRNVQGIALLEKTLVSALIQLHGIIKTVLSVVDIGKIAVQPRQSKSVSESAECRARLICQLKRSLVLARIYERLHDAADGERSLEVISGLLKTRTRTVVFLYRLPIISIEGNHVPKSPGTLGGYRRIVEFRRHPGAGLRQPRGTLRVHAQQKNSALIEPLKGFLVSDWTLASKKDAPLLCVL